MVVMRLGGPRTTIRARRRATKLASGAVSAALLLVLAACGDDTSDPDATEDPSASGSPSASASATPGGATPDPDAPACDEVWVEGARIPRGYAGCNADEGYVEADRLSCSSGQVLVRHEDLYFGVVGGKVRVAKSTLDDDAGYRASVAKCRG
jgi:hypothetical protein